MNRVSYFEYKTDRTIPKRNGVQPMKKPLAGSIRPCVSSSSIFANHREYRRRAAGKRGLMWFGAVQKKGGSVYIQARGVDRESLLQDRPPDMPGFGGDRCGRMQIALSLALKGRCGRGKRRVGGGRSTLGVRLAVRMRLDGRVGEGGC